MGSHFRLFLFMFQLILNNPLNGRRVPKKVFFSWLNTNDSSQSWDTLCPGMSPSHRNCYFLAHPNQFSGEVSFLQKSTLPKSSSSGLLVHTCSLCGYPLKTLSPGNGKPGKNLQSLTDYFLSLVSTGREELIVLLDEKGKEYQ